MTVFIDTSAFFATMDADDEFHSAAKARWISLLESEAHLVTTNYVLVEAAALVQKRLGLDAVRVLTLDMQPATEVKWITSGEHELAISALLAANRRQLSLVDLTSFAIMREHRIDSAFTYDTHFAEQGFSVLQ